MAVIGKICLLLSLSFLSVCEIFANDSYTQVLIVEFNNGTPPRMFEFSDEPKIDFSSPTKVRVLMPNSSDELLELYGDIKKIYFKDNTYVDIEDVVENEGVVLFRYLDSEHVDIQGVKSNDIVGIYGVDGRKANVGMTKGEGTVTISLTGLPEGVYVIKMNKESYKIYRR